MSRNLTQSKSPRHSRKTALIEFGNVSNSTVDRPNSIIPATDKTKKTQQKTIRKWSRSTDATLSVSVTNARRGCAENALKSLRTMIRG
mmetsp:Transcript_119452/g.219772  ORF Transcript_119452/g.219772 Transcript_119452/m.219772 type:complete len:88 (-) Transcript_119452:176-439(-)